MEVDARFRKYVSILPQGKKTQNVVKRILEKETAYKLFLYNDRSLGVKKVADIKSNMERLFSDAGQKTAAKFHTILEHWNRDGRLTEIAWLVYHWYREEKIAQAPKNPPAALADKTEAARKAEAARVEAAKVEVAKAEATRQAEVAKAEAIRQAEVVKAEAARQAEAAKKAEAARAEAARVEAARKAEVARQAEAARQAEVARVESVKAESARAEAAREVATAQKITPAPGAAKAGPGQNRKVDLLKSALAQLSLKETCLNSPPSSLYDSSSDENETKAWNEGEDWLLTGQSTKQQANGECDSEEIKKSTVFSGDILRTYASILPQYGLLGIDNAIDHHSEVDKRLFWNTNQPSSVYICGLQGSGKSHTLSCLLENCLIQSPSLGKLTQPLSGVVFHYSQFTSTSYFHPCEAAFLGVPSPDFPGRTSRVSTTVYCSPSNYHCLSASYGEIPGVAVKRLLFRPEQLSIATMLQLMAVNDGSQNTLYMSQVTKILREMAAASGSFNFLEFKRHLAALRLIPAQKNLLDQRMSLLESFLDLDGSMSDGPFSFSKGSLTIVDLSCPFVDDNMACVLFDIFLRIYFETDASESSGKVVALDEAHRYLTATPASKALTMSLLGLIRQQRHFGARIIISSQEPTLDPRLLDLSSMLVFHRFTSPAWAKSLGHHVPLEDGDNNGRVLLDKVTSLRTGEAVVFAPNGILSGNEDGLRKVRSELINIVVRKRVTWDGGHSVVSVV